ncbi:MAG: orotidine-5'-phosphate decarboxylase [Ferrimicrobium sp.]
MTLAGSPDRSEAMRPRLIIALDLDDQVRAVRVAKAVAPYFGVAKVGLELFSSSGPSIIYALRELGLQIFIDLKLFDIPTTVFRTARVLGSYGVNFVTFHTSGGEEMVRAGVEGLFEGASKGGHKPPLGLGVTVLTSEAIATQQVLTERLGVAIRSGCQGYVAAASDLITTRALAPHLVCVVPGIRPHGVSVHDQERVVTPEDAIRAGADYLVVGRAVTRTDDPARAAAEIALSCQ